MKFRKPFGKLSNKSSKFAGLGMRKAIRNGDATKVGEWFALRSVGTNLSIP